MLENRKITYMTEEEINELSYEKMELFLNFKDLIEDYFDSIGQVQAAKNNTSHHFMEKMIFRRWKNNIYPSKFIVNL